MTIIGKKERTIAYFMQYITIFKRAILHNVSFRDKRCINGAVAIINKSCRMGPTGRLKIVVTYKFLLVSTIMCIQKSNENNLLASVAILP